MIGRTNDHDVIVRLEAVHLGQDLVECGAARTALTLPAALPSQQTVDLVDEDKAGGILASFSEELSDASSTHAHVHLVEVGAGRVDEVAVGLACDRPCKQCLASSWLTQKHDSLEELRALLLILLGVLDDLDYILNLVLDLVDAFDVF